MSFSLHDAAAAEWHRISPGDTVKLAVIKQPATADDFSVSLEVWDIGGSQPPNSHPGAVETFFFVRGEGIATSDGAETPVRAGQLLVLPAGSVHHIRNTGSERLYAITTMLPDHGFSDLIRRGPLDSLDAEDLAVLSHTPTQSP